MQRFPAWKTELEIEGEADIECITQSMAYKSSVNVFAVRGLLASMRDNPNVKVKLMNPPSNENMRFGSYRAAAYLMKLTLRAPLSACMVSSIRATYPDHRGQYRGYLDAQEK